MNREPTMTDDVCLGNKCQTLQVAWSKIAHVLHSFWSFYHTLDTLFAHKQDIAYLYCRHARYNQRASD